MIIDHPLATYRRQNPFGRFFKKGFSGMGTAIDCTQADAVAIIQNVQQMSNSYIQQLIPLLQAQNALAPLQSNVQFYQYALNNVVGQYNGITANQSASFQQVATLPPYDATAGNIATAVASLPPYSIPAGINYTQTQSFSPGPLDPVINPSTRTYLPIGGTVTLTTTVFPWLLTNPNNPADQNLFPIGNPPVMPSNPDTFTTQYMTMLINIYTTLLPYAQQYQNILAQLVPAQQALASATTTANNNLNALETEINDWATPIVGGAGVTASPYLACLTGIPISFSDLMTAAQAQITAASQAASATPATSTNSTTGTSSSGGQMPSSTQVTETPTTDTGSGASAIQSAAQNIPITSGSGLTSPYSQDIATVNNQLAAAQTAVSTVYQNLINSQATLTAALQSWYSNITNQFPGNTNVANLMQSLVAELPTWAAEPSVNVDQYLSVTGLQNFETFAVSTVSPFLSTDPIWTALQGFQAAIQPLTDAVAAAQAAYTQAQTSVTQLTAQQSQLQNENQTWLSANQAVSTPALTVVPPVTTAAPVSTPASTAQTPSSSPVSVPVSAPVTTSTPATKPNSTMYAMIAAGLFALHLSSKNK